MSCSTALSWAQLYPAALLGASRAGLPVVRHRRLSGALSALSLSVWSGVDFWRIAARRPRSAGGVLPDGSRRRIRWRSRVALIRRRCPTCWRSLAGGLQRRSGPAEVPARQSRLRDPRCKQYSEVCEPGGVQFIDFGSDPDFNNCVDGLVLVDLTYLKANRYQRYIGAHLGAQNRHKVFPGLARCALAGLWFTVSDGSVARKRRVRRRLRKAAGNVLRGLRLMP